MAAKKKSRKASAEAAVEVPPDPRAPLPQTPESWDLTRQELEKALAAVPPPEEPRPGDFIEAMLHIYFADGIACGFGQEARRRILETYVDRNEFRVTEAFEVEDMLSDLEIPDLFDRCLDVRESIGQIYNDQNGVKLDFLREASVSDRNNFFQRTPALRPFVANFLVNLLTVEDLCFSEKSTLRSQQKMGMEPKDKAAQDFITAVRGMLAPYGHLPLEIGPHQPGGKPNTERLLSPACLMVRLLPVGRKR
ncbi:MAG: hypothetical protein VYE77_06615 [Planctomycetota bacterium]|nr:hypothetical protein [Planctomycetota bacterium]